MLDLIFVENYYLKFNLSPVLCRQYVNQFCNKKYDHIPFLILYNMFRTPFYLYDTTNTL